MPTASSLWPVIFMVDVVEEVFFSSSILGLAILTEQLPIWGLSPPVTDTQRSLPILTAQALRVMCPLLTRKPDIFHQGSPHLKIWVFQPELSRIFPIRCLFISSAVDMEL